MVELNKCEFYKVERFAKMIKSDTVYIYSILDGNQEGRIFVDDLSHIGNVLFWHYCKFGFVAGNAKDTDFNNDLGKLLSRNYEVDQAKLVLAVSDEKWRKVVEKQILKYNTERETIKITKHYKFKFNKQKFKARKWDIPSGYELQEIDEKLIEKLEGRIIPRFSWKSNESFLKKGKGFCLLHGKDIVCTVFSAGIGNKQMDIGIETSPDYRGKGLGKVTGAQMVKYALSEGYEPIWGCDIRNIGSSSIAKALGFEIIDEYDMDMR